jgi:hypothetical protein
MAYTKNNLISRAGYGTARNGRNGMGDVWDSITGAAGSVLKFYGTSQQAVGAAAASQQQNRDLTAALMARQGMSTQTVLLIGGAGLAAFLLLRKKSAP